MQEWRAVRYIRSLWNRQDLRAPLVAEAANDEEAVELLPREQPLEMVVNFLPQLPKPVLQQLLGYLTLEDIKTLRLVCRHFRYTYNDLFRTAYTAEKSRRALRWSAATRHAIIACPFTPHYTQEMQDVFLYCLNVLDNADVSWARKRQAMKRLYRVLMHTRLWVSENNEALPGWQTACNVVTQDYKTPHRLPIEFMHMVLGFTGVSTIDGFDQKRIRFRTMLRAAEGCLAITRGHDRQPLIDVTQFNEVERQNIHWLKKMRQRLIVEGGAVFAISSLILLAQMRVMSHGMPENEVLQFLVALMFYIPQPLLYTLYVGGGMSWVVQFYMTVEQYNATFSKMMNGWKYFSEDNRREDEALARLDPQPVQEPVLSSARQFVYRNYNAVRNWFFPPAPIDVADIENQLDAVIAENRGP